MPIAEDEAMPPVIVTTETALDGSYPLRRYLYIYVNKKPDTPLNPLEFEFLRMVLSQTGQEVVDKDGYVPLSARMVNRELKRLSI